ncbi:capsid protein [Liquorilactobacillus satsumensis]|uniref:phage tail tube protein n=1 Tax=Liquorilactobacillus satsumensis TaxID=259059 RepID=UPI0021C41680|nr:capsid protein [Liquorilactobacillus satsumensis]MCP9357373.1 capsid protein [Liquorilactobacillus satsumensis]MCP9372067.1 capsid protein [Liquorilactobacillus satsumensis]
MTGFDLNYKNKYEIDTKGSMDPTSITGASFAPLAAGISQVTPSSNEKADTTEYYDGEGFGGSDVTGKRFQLAFTGNRKTGDAAQDYVASHELSVGDDLKTLLRWTDPQGNVVIGQVTMTAIVAAGGNAGAKQKFSFTAVFNGKPQFTAATSGTTGQ